MKLIYAFRYRHERTGKWVQARYRAELDEIRVRYGEWAVVGQPMIIEPDAAAPFNPFRAPPTGR
jgi:hypothetical protein